MKARQIPLVLAMLLIFSLASPNAHAASELPVSNEGELLSAVASAADGDVIRLTDSITCTSAITVLSKSITFNLDGNNLNVITDSDIALDVRNGGVALFGSGELNVSGKYCGVKAEISTVTVTNVTAREFSSLAGHAVRCSGGSITVRENVIHTGRYGRGVWANYGGKVEVLRDVTVTAKDSLAIEAINEGSSVTVHGNCQAIGTPSFCGISVQNKATVTVNGSLASTGYYVRAYTTLLTAAEWNSGNAPYENYRIYFEPGSDQTVVRLQNQVPAAKSPIPTLSITTGTSAVVGGSDLATDADISDTLTITEIVSAPDSAIATAVLSEGSIHISAAASGNTSISVVVTDAFSAANTVTISINVPAVCSIGETGYPELADALTAAKDGDEIKLLDNISFNNFSVSGKEVTLNLNGYTLNVGGTNAAEVGSGGRLTILGAGTFTAAGTKYGIYVHDAGVFNYSGTGMFTLSGRERCVYADGEGSSVSVPSVTQIESSGVGVYAGAGATINVTGDVSASGWFNTCVNAAGGTITVSGNVLNTGKEGKAVRASAGGRVTVNGTVSGSNPYNYGAYAESGGSITVGGPVLGYYAAYADGTGSSITALHSVISVNGIGAYAKNGAVISVGIDITGGEARAESGGKIMVGRDIVSSGVNDSYGAKAAGGGSSVEVGRNVSASGGLVSVGANATDGGTVTIHGSITGAAGSMLSCGAWANVGTITVNGTINSSGIYIRTAGADKTAAGYTLGAPPYENYKVYQSGPSIVRVKIPTVINSVTAAPPTLPVSGGTVAVTVSGYNIPTGIMVAAFDESGAATGITGLTTGSVNVQTALLTFPANTVITEKTYTIKVSLNGGAAWNAAMAAVTVEPLIIHTITATAGSGGNISPSGTVSVTEGNTRTFAITPDSGYQIAWVTVDGIGQGAVTTHTFANVTASHTIHAAFYAKWTPTFTVTYDLNGGTGIVPIDTTTYEEGNTVTLPRVPVRTGYKFKEWNTETDGRGTTFTSDTIITKDITVYAIWMRKSEDTGGNAPIIITPPTSPSTDSIFVIPPAFLSDPDGDGKITFTNDVGRTIISSKMQSGVIEAEGKSVAITIKRGNLSRLPDDVKAAIGQRPLISITLTIDGKPVDWSNPDAPVTVSIPYTPTAEELINPENIVIWYIDGSGNVVTIPNGRYDTASKTVTFSTTHFSDYAVVYNPVSFRDVDGGAWYNKAVNFLAAREITNGTGDDNFSPDAKLTRGEFIVLLMRAYGVAPDANPTDNFSDAGSTYYTGYLAAAKRLGLANGVGNNRYAPELEITRQEMFTLLYNILKSVNQLPQGGSFNTISDFSDADQVDSWAKEAVALLVKTGVVEGYAGKLDPTGGATRAETAQVLYNILRK